MTDFPDSHRDLLDAEVATLGTIDPRGFPQLSEVWFLFDEGEVKLSLNTARLKTMNMQARPECSLFILDLANPYRYLEVRGRARIEPDGDYAFADKVGAKYGGTDLRTIDRPGESRVVVDDRAREPLARGHARLSSDERGRQPEGRRPRSVKRAYAVRAKKPINASNAATIRTKKRNLVIAMPPTMANRSSSATSTQIKTTVTS